AGPVPGAAAHQRTVCPRAESALPANPDRHPCVRGLQQLPGSVRCFRGEHSDSPRSDSLRRGGTARALRPAIRGVLRARAAADTQAAPGEIELIGEMISRYRILEEIGRGSMGTVYKAQDTFLGRFAAVKLIAEKYLQDREALGRFEREGQAASALSHPNIC